ncbi:MAG: GNAT family N-acetyltransferase [Thermocladium sp.]
MGEVTEKLEGEEELVAKDGKTTYKIREFSLRDLQSVTYINRAVLPENYPDFFFVEHHMNFPKSFIVAELGGKIVGYVMTRVEFGWSNLRRGGVARKGHIVSIGVLPEARRLGVAYNLMIRSMRAMKRFYNASEVYLEVRVSNAPAIGLYTKLGYKIVSTLRGYYQDGEDAYIMARTLSDYS